MPTEDNRSAPTSATLTEYTLTIEATCIATVVVKSTSPMKFTPWYGIGATCYHCGAYYGEDGIQCSRSSVEPVRRAWLALFEAGEVSPPRGPS